MDESPEPDFSGFFSDLQRLHMEEGIEIKWRMLPVETSRGCWWGQKSHCVFCGIDDETMKYRERSTSNTLRLLYNLRKKYNTKYFRFSDYILPHSYYKTLLPILAAMPESDRFVLTCELKANLSRERFKLLRDAGFVEVQPGIESFSSPVLKRMAKGVTGIQNVLCLVLGSTLGIRVNYNFLFGFPDDDPSDYEQLLTVIPQLYHLHPPSSCVEVALTRFAPLQSNPERFGIAPALNAHPGYDVMFSPEFLEQHSFRMRDYCYYFETSYDVSDALKALYRLLLCQVEHWRRLHTQRKVVLRYRLEDGGIVFTDSRYDEVPQELRFDEQYAVVFLACTERIVATPDLMETVRSTAPDIDVESILEELIDARLIFREGTRLVALAVADHASRMETDESIGWTLQKVS